VIGQLYGSVADAWVRVRDELDLELGDLLTIPQGEVALGVVALQEPNTLAAVAIIDVADQLPLAQKVLARAATLLEQRGAAKTELDSGGTLLTVYEIAGEPARRMVFGEREGTLLVGTDVGVLQGVLERWSAQQSESLRQNDRFTTIMASVRGNRDEQVQLTWFVDPIELARAGTRGSPAQVGLAVLPALGLDGLHGAGGSFAFASDEFDTIMHLHVLLDNPRAGVVELVALGSGDTTPERWVPDNVSSYSTAYIDVATAYRKLAGLFDSFRGDGAWKRMADRRLSEPLGIDFEQELLPALTGRVSYVTLVEQPVTLTSQASIVAAHLHDADAFRPTFEKIFSNFGDRLERKTLGSHTYYQLQGPAQASAPDAPPPNLPCFALAEGCLLIADRASVIQKILIGSTDPQASLAAALDFKLIASKARRISGGAEPSLTTFRRPEEGMRLLYGLASADTNRQALRGGGEFLQSIDRALEQNPLPPFEVIAQYFAPGGAVLYDDETGFHYVGFTLRRK
jgi:hypothetical protein